jgi:hypothetical protein
VDRAFERMVGASYAAVAAERAAVARQAVADRLRRLAEVVEGKRFPVSSLADPTVPDFLTPAADVVHEVVWGVAHLGLDTLVGDCAEAQRAAQADRQDRQGSSTTVRRADQDGAE